MVVIHKCVKKGKMMSATCHKPAQKALLPAPLMRIAQTLGSEFHSVRRRLISTHISMLRLLRAFSLFKIIFLEHPRVDETIGVAVEQNVRLSSMTRKMKGVATQKS